MVVRSERSLSITHQCRQNLVGSLFASLVLRNNILLTKLNRPDLKEVKYSPSFVSIVYHNVINLVGPGSIRWQPGGFVGVKMSMLRLDEIDQRHTIGGSGSAAKDTYKDTGHLFYWKALCRILNRIVLIFRRSMNAVEENFLINFKISLPTSKFVLFLIAAVVHIVWW